MAEAMLTASIPAILAIFDIQRSDETPEKPEWTDKLARSVIHIFDLSSNGIGTESESIGIV